MPKPKVISKQQIKVIRGYVKQGLSANKIQKRLQKQHLGIRRKTLLSEVRKIKGTKKKPYSVKHTPKKYRRRVSPPARRPIYSGKHIAIYRPATTRRYRRMAKKLGMPEFYSARYEFYGDGKDLGKAVGLALSGIVPRWENPHVECSAGAFLKDPYKFGERGEWLGRPIIES